MTGKTTENLRARVRARIAQLRGHRAPSQLDAKTAAEIARLRQELRRSYPSRERHRRPPRVRRELNRPLSTDEARIVQRLTEQARTGRPEMPMWRLLDELALESRDGTSYMEMKLRLRQLLGELQGLVSHGIVARHRPTHSVFLS